MWCSRRWSGTCRRSPWCGTRIAAARRAGHARHHRPADRGPDRLPQSPVQPPSRQGHAALGGRAVRAAALHAEDAAGLRRLSHKHDLPVYTHVYETRGQRLIARELFADHDGSLITYLERNGLLGPRLNIVHSVWINREEMDRMAAADAGIVLNHLSNLKLKSGIAPVLDMREAGVRLGLGCDNCSGSDVQSIFQAMKTFCLFAAVSDPEPGAPLAHEVLRHATLGNARSAGLQGKVGALKPGHKADMVLIDLNDTAYLPYNSAARQLVYTETGRGIDSVMIDGRMVMQERRVTTIDEDGVAPRGREPDEALHRRIRGRDEVARPRAALHARRASQDVGAGCRHETASSRGRGRSRCVTRSRRRCRSA